MTLRKLIPNAPPGLVLKPRKEGRFQAYFQAPKDRPASFPATVPLPFVKRDGKLEAEELAAIAKDGWEIYREYEQAVQAQQNPDSRRVTWVDLAEMWINSSVFGTKAPVTQEMYRYWARRLAKELDAKAGHEPHRINETRIDEHFQALSPEMAARYLTVIRAMLDKAVREGVRQPLVLQLGQRKVRKGPPRPLWEFSDLEEYEAALLETGDMSLAGILVTAMETAQRVGDVRTFRMGKHYTSDGCFRYHQSKTSAYVSFPAPPRMRRYIDHLALADGDLLFPDPAGGEYSWRSLCGAFGWRKRKFLRSGRVSRDLTMQTLRHSGVIQLARAGCTAAEIASLTGHAYAYIQEMFEIYLRRDSACAVNAIERREQWRQTGISTWEPAPNFRADAPRFIQRVPPPGASLH